MGYPEQLKIKSYEDFDVFLHKDQVPYWGRIVAVAKREGAKDIANMTREEAQDLVCILEDWSQAISVFFVIDTPEPWWPNLISLGNVSPRLEIHLIPRYSKPFTRYDLEFRDPNPGSFPDLQPGEQLSLETLLEITEEMKEFME